MHICAPRRFCGCATAIWAQSCNLDWQRIAYNQLEKKKKSYFGQPKRRPTGWSAGKSQMSSLDWRKKGKRVHTRYSFNQRADGNICVADSEPRAAKTLHRLMSVLTSPRGQTRQPMINTSLTQTTALLAVKSQSAANGPDISHAELHTEHICSAINGSL